MYLGITLFGTMFEWKDTFKLALEERLMVYSSPQVTTNRKKSRTRKSQNQGPSIDHGTTELTSE